MAALRRPGAMDAPFVFPGQTSRPLSTTGVLGIDPHVRDGPTVKHRDWDQAALDIEHGRCSMRPLVTAPRHQYRGRR